MSTDTARENASVVDSSLTEWKNDTGTVDDPETPSCRRNEDPPSAMQQILGYDQMENSKEIVNGNLCGTRYFVIKSLSHENIQLSVENGIWATQVMNEPILEDAFHNSRRVILIFSVNMSGFFQGYAEMMSSVGWRRDTVWTQGTGSKHPWGRSFRIRWLRLHDLPFQKTLHLRNPLNGYKPVKISRDCQELPQHIGEALCDLFGEKDDLDANFKMDEFLSERPCLESRSSMQNEAFGIPPLQMGWANNSPMIYSSLFHPHYQAEANRYPGSAKFAHHKQSRVNLGNNNCQQLDQISSSHHECRGLSAERSSLMSTLTDDNILEMSYEEYLEAHSRSSKRLYQPVVGVSREKRESTSKDDNGGSDSSQTDQSEKKKMKKRKNHHHHQSSV
ncbi:YTH domain-containing protein 1 [Impatiens glandulifera]|uniref:YTH domain-containing protein 1 n=1 Tax=Impatiens glandulifera TaxID=253017 RepID=UPI001FB0A193|nr:YTH domain-containing protein 1 [Impatiens glandulifera]